VKKAPAVGAARSAAARALAPVRDWLGQLNPHLRAPLLHPPLGMPRVLLIGLYLGQQRNSAEHLVTEYGRARRCTLEQRWIGLKSCHPSRAVRDVTVDVRKDFSPKFSILNELLGSIDLDEYDYVVFSDDDIRVRSGFIDSFIGCQQHYDLAVAQPARTLNSFNDHAVVRQRLGSAARQTWFVEIGPLFSLRRDAMELLVPFDEASPMGYGYDFVWPKIARKFGKKMGVVDCCPVDHSMRKRSVTYSYDEHMEVMRRFLEKHEHVSYAEAMTTVQMLR
jgi:hypothetical protein